MNSIFTELNCTSFKKLCCYSLVFFTMSISGQVSQFLNISEDVGISSFSDGDYGNGVSFYDWDSDGYDDIVLLGDVDFVQFYKNNQGVFELVNLEGIQLSAPAKSVNWVDINNDREPDLAFNLSSGAFSVFLNTGNFQFVDISSTCGIDQTSSQGYGQSWADYNNDGYIDVYICNYQNSYYLPQRTNYLYRNNGDGTFTNTTAIAGVSNGYQLTFLSIWMDYDKDSWPDLFIFNDRSAHENALYRNNGDGTFTDVSVASNFNEIYDPMSGSVADFDNDGWLDIYSTNTVGNKLYRNTGQGTFVDVAAENNAQMFLYSWGALWTDIDGDTKEDLMVAVSSFSVMYNSLYYLHRTEQGFESNQTMGLGYTFGQAYSIGLGDFNNDGRPEILSHNKQPEGCKLWTLDGADYNYIKVNLIGSLSNRDATGSWIELYSAGVKQTRYTLNGEQYLSQNSQWKFFGLGASDYVDSLIVHWPSGLSDKLYDFHSNQNIVIREGETIQCELQIVGNYSACVGDTVLLDAGVWDEYLWPDSTTERYFQVTESGTYYVIVQVSGHTVYSQPLNIVFEDIDNYQPVIQGIYCYGDSSDVYFTDPSGNQIELIQWNSNEVSNEYFVGANELLSYSFTTNSGCYIEGQLQLTQPELLTLDLNVQLNDEIGICPYKWQGSVIPNGGVGDYEVVWEFYIENDSLPFLTYSGLSFNCADSENSILLKCIVQDGNNCVASEEMLLQGLSNSNPIEKASFKLFPNPFDGFIRIDGNLNSHFVRIYNLQGEIVLTKIVDSYQFLINTNNLSSGSYIVELESKEDIQHVLAVKK
jgi:hypothetical protein